jgi:4-hydroxysphinganine ceramide fatty acyl 2-hydroxylase
LKKAIVPQLAKLSKQEYLLLVDRPQYLETTDSIILYENEWEDWWVRSDITLNQRVMIPISIGCFAAALWLNHDKEASMLDNIIHCVGIFILGAMAWTGLEYKEHRFTLHNFDSIPEKFNEKDLGKFFYTHHLHHMFSNQEYRIVIPLWHIAKVTAIWFTLEYLAFGLVFAMAFNSGLLLAQIFYDSMHFWFHFGGDFKIKWFQDLKEKHMRHHYRDKTKDFGVTTSFWDYVFDTI